MSDGRIGPDSTAQNLGLGPCGMLGVWINGIAPRPRETRSADEFSGYRRRRRGTHYQQPRSLEPGVRGTEPTPDEVHVVQPALDRGTAREHVPCSRRPPRNAARAAFDQPAPGRRLARIGPVCFDLAPFPRPCSSRLFLAFRGRTPSRHAGQARAQGSRSALVRL